MQRETHGCTLHVFKSTFQFWPMITSNPHFHSHCFFLSLLPLFLWKLYSMGLYSSPWHLRASGDDRHDFTPICFGESMLLFYPLMSQLIEGLTWWSLVCCGVPQDSVGSMEVPALFTLSISQVCYEWLVFCWALGVLRFLGFSGLTWILHKFFMWENKQTALFDNLMLPQHFREHASLAGKILFIYI